MEFHEKLQEMRKQRGLTQEALAQELYVSRTAISKWESGRGYPNIDSLKAIAKYFSVSIDSLLSGEEALSIAEEEYRQKKMRLLDLVFGALDLSCAMLLFLPFFGQHTDGIVYSVSLSSLNGIAPFLKLAYFSIAAGMAAWGILMLALQNCRQAFWLRIKHSISLMLNGLGVLMFIASPQPYAAAFLFVLLAGKAFPAVKMWFRSPPERR